MCEEKKTLRCKMSDYINELKNDGYVPLRTQYYTNLQTSFPALDKNHPPSLTDPGQVDMLDQQTDQEEHPEIQVEEEMPQVPPPAQDTSAPKELSNVQTLESMSVNDVTDAPPSIDHVLVSEAVNDVTDAPPNTDDDLTSTKIPPTTTLTKVSISVPSDKPGDEVKEVETEHSDVPKDTFPIGTGSSVFSLGIEVVTGSVENTDSSNEAQAEEASEEDISVLEKALSELPLSPKPADDTKASSKASPAEAASENISVLADTTEAFEEDSSVPAEATGASGGNTGALAETKKKSLPKPKTVHILKGAKSDSSLKAIKNLSDSVPDPTKTSSAATLSFPKDMNKCSVSLLRGPNPPKLQTNIKPKIPFSQPTPNQMLAPPSPLFTPNKLNIKASSGQGLYHYEIPLMRFVTESKPYEEVEA